MTLDATWSDLDQVMPDGENNTNICRQIKPMHVTQHTHTNLGRCLWYDLRKRYQSVPFKALPRGFSTLAPDISFE